MINSGAVFSIANSFMGLVSTKTFRVIRLGESYERRRNKRKMFKAIYHQSQNGVLGKKRKCVLKYAYSVYTHCILLIVRSQRIRAYYSDMNHSIEW